MLKLLFPTVYQISAIRPLDERKVLFVEVTSAALSNNFFLLLKSIKNNYHLPVRVHFLRTGFCNKWLYLWKCLRLVSDAATAKYVFISDASNIFGCIPIRRGSIFTQIWHGCGAFKRFGLSASECSFGDDREDLLRYPNYTYNTYMTVSSPSVIWAYSEATGLPPDRIAATGISRTDVFFDKNFHGKAFKNLRQVMPKADGKKVILYAPTFRGYTSHAQAPDRLSISLMFKQLSSTHVLLIKHHPLVRQRPEIPEKYSGFARDVSDEMDIEELLCVADICITDYSSLIFEYSLLERPMLFFSYDLEEYYDWRGFFYDYREMVPGPILETTDDLTGAILHIDEGFDRERVRRFKEYFMSSCDGNATERILDMVFSGKIKTRTPLGEDT